VPPITDISYLYEIVAYPIAWMADAIAWPMPLSPLALPLWRDLTPLVEKDADLTFYPFAAAAYQSAGKTWALPWTAQPALIRYDRAAFDAAGVPYPRPGWTQDEFLSIARQMTVREGENIVRYGFVDITGWPMARAWVEGRAGSLVDRSQTPGVPELDSPQAIEALRWYTDLALRHKVMPAIDSGGGMGDNVEPYLRLVERGQAAMWTDSAPAWEQYRGRSDVGLVPYPVARYGANPWQVSGLAISNLTPHAQESWLWVRFLSDQDPVGRSTANSMLSLPARPSMAEATGYWEQWDSEMRAVLQDAVKHAWAFRYDECTFPLQRAIDAIWKGQTVEAALAEAQESAMRGRPGR
jgi:ABC-type glycerol-3-phosphate transport system substrate-binding protein